jgi:hypothetical protein
MSASNEKITPDQPSYGDGGHVEDTGGKRRRPTDFNMEKLSATFENPLANVAKEQLLSDVETFCKQYNLVEYMDEFKKGALVAQSPTEAQTFQELSREDKLALEREHTHRWSQPWQLYWLASESSLLYDRTTRANIEDSHVLTGGGCTRNG